MLPIHVATAWSTSTIALKSVDLTLYAGEVLALIGENGAGKSMLMTTLSVAHTADAKTLGGYKVVRGLAKGIAGNQEINPPSDNWLFTHLMSPVRGVSGFNWALFPAGVWLTIGALIFAVAMLRYTKFGRRVYAVGSSEPTARLCGVPVNRTKIFVYMIAGVFIGLAGVLEFSKLNIGQPTGALRYELYVIAACVIGGTSLNGGVGTLIGALIIGTLYAGAQQADWPKWFQEVAIGIIIVAAATLDQLRNRSKHST